MLVSGSLVTDMRISRPEFHKSNVVKFAVVYFAKPDKEPAFQRRFPRNDPSTTLAAFPCKFGVALTHLNVRPVCDPYPGIAERQGQVHRRDDS